MGTLAGMAQAAEEQTARLAFVAGMALAGEHCDDDGEWLDTREAQAARALVARMDALALEARGVMRALAELAGAGNVRTLAGARVDGLADVVLGAELR